MLDLHHKVKRRGRMDTRIQCYCCKGWYNPRQTGYTVIWVNGPIRFYCSKWCLGLSEGNCR